MKKVSKILNVLSIILFIIFIVTLSIDLINYNEFMSAPFYASIIVRLIEFALPALICIVISLIINKRGK